MRTPVRTAIWPAGRTRETGQTLKETHHKNLLIAIALVTAFAAPAMAETFPNFYMSR